MSKDHAKDKIRAKAEAEKAKRKAEATDKQQAAAQAPPREPPPDIEAYYESGKSCFWTLNGKSQWQRFTTDEMTNLLKCRGYLSRTYDGQSVSEVDRYLYSVRFHRSVDFAGELAGWTTGRHQIGDTDVLITRGRVPIKPAPGESPLLKQFLKTLLPGRQLLYFLGWLKGSLEALERGRPFRPGQLLALAGEHNSGKSFLQMLITRMLGGRQGDPTQYLLGRTDFTGDFFKAEHLAIEDKALKDFSHAKRREFAGNLKGLVVNQQQWIHGKGKEAQLLPVGTRITLTTNCTPDAIAILPALERGVADKVIYFLCGTGELPARDDEAITWGQQEAMFAAELPHFLHWLKGYRIPQSVRDPGNRMTVASFHHPDIVDMLAHLTPEQRLISLLTSLPLCWDGMGVKKGNAATIEQWIDEKDDKRKLERICTYTSALGTLLGKIARSELEKWKASDGEEYQRAVIAEDGADHKRIFTLYLERLKTI